MNRKQDLAEAIARDQAEMEGLLSNKEELFSRNRKDWIIVVFEINEIGKYARKFVAECTKSSGSKLTTQLSMTSEEAYGRACNLVDENEKQLQQDRSFIDHYQVLKPLYLMLIYLSGGDEHYDYLKIRPKKCGIENFIGVGFYVRFSKKNRFGDKIIAQLEKEELIKRSSTRNSLILSKKGMQVARDMLKTINMDGVEKLLEQRNYHEDYINDKSQLDLILEQSEEE